MTDRGQQPIAPDGPEGEDSRTAPHPTSIAVWGVPSPVVVDGRFAVQVGVKCAAGCPLAGQPVVVRNEAGADVGHGRLGENRAPGTEGLYGTEVMLAAPSQAGIHSWTVAFVAPGPGSAPPGKPVPAQQTMPAHDARPVRDAAPAPDVSPPFGPPPECAPVHANATAAFGFRTVRPPEHRVTVTVCDRDTETPLANAEVRVGIYRGETDARGEARVEVRAGSYDLYVRKAGYAPHTDSVWVSGDVTLRVATVRPSDADPDDEQVWM